MIPITPPAAYARPPILVGRFPQFISTRFTEKDGLPAGAVRTVELAGRRILVQTDRGAIVFDGTRWVPEANPPVSPLPPAITVNDVPPGEHVTSWAKTRN